MPATTNAKLTPSGAKRILHSLMQSGQPPKVGAEHINVGTDKIIKELVSGYIDDMLRADSGDDGIGACKFPVAPYGEGKTQFIRVVESIGLEKDYLVSVVSFSADECTLDRPETLYKAIACEISAKGDTGQPIKGLDRVLLHLVRTKLNNDETAILDWVENSLEFTEVDMTAYRNAVATLIRATITNDRESSRIAASYLRGEDVPLTELKTIGVYDNITKQNGLRPLRSMTQIIQRSGLAAGTLLFLDEGRRSLTFLSAKNQKRACENILTLVNDCNDGRFPGTMFLIAVTPEFFTETVPLYDALKQRCSHGSRINVQDLGIPEKIFFQKMGANILGVADLAFNLKSLETFKLNVDFLAERSAGQVHTGWGKRHFAKCVSKYLFDFSTAKPEKLTAEEADNLIEETDRELASYEQVEE